ncbi:hypothetical protein [Aquimarina aquimarini]|uniref:hypothetical protein n=1 Tax=Aquimarina aquimarini TaxID=1191734 RepID=UPI00131F4108|nr:hypothetical protein [Aquimarina aquimarini]
MEQKIELICEWRTEKYTIIELCKSFGSTNLNNLGLKYIFENIGIENLDLQDTNITNNELNIYHN